MVVLLGASVLIQIAAWAMLIKLFTGRHWWYGFFDVSDVGLYHDIADQMARGLFPYKDFSFEYPPLAAPLMWIPRYGQALGSYNWCFAAEMIFCSVLTSTLVTATAARLWRGWRAPLSATLAFACTTVLAGPIVANRFDIAVALVMAAFMCCLVRRSWWQAGVVLGIGFALKLTPIILFPLVLVLMRKRLHMLTTAIAFAFAAVAPFLPHLMRAGSAVGFVFSYHGKRPLQIESILSTPYLLRQVLGLGTVAVRSSYGSQGIVAPGTSTLAALSPWLMATGLTMLYGFLWRRRRQLRASWGDLPTAALALVLVCVCTSKVLSPQFLVWIFPLVALVAAGKRSAHKQIGILLLVVILLTQVEFPSSYWGLVALKPWPVALVASRNVGLLGATIMVIVYLRTSLRSRARL
jgi:hypothetical protein